MSEWLWAAAMLAAPVVVFSGIEAVGYLRRRRMRALARRSKGPGKVANKESRYSRVAGEKQKQLGEQA